jgi:hypothetical protein
VAYTLPQLKAHVREHMDLDATELPDSLLDFFAREGSERIRASRDRWAHFETSVTFATVADQQEYDLTTIAADIDQISAIRASDRSLSWLGPDMAERTFTEDSSSTGDPHWFAQWGSDLLLYPTPGSVETLTVRYVRTMIDWVAANTSPDLPPQFHNAVRLWMLGAAYNQQEDPEMGIMYLDMFNDEVVRLLRVTDNVPSPQPLVVNGRHSGGNIPGGRLRYPWD